MKIERFTLGAYGHFVDKTLDFSADNFGLHVVFGPNEAGKSTALRGLTCLLYGFGHRAEDAWLHQSKDLAVAGRFRLDQEKTLNLTRYKRRKNDLIDDDTGKPFSQEQLEKYLGKLGREAFRHTYGISHDSLRLGVESVLAAGGGLGQTLFAATSGLNSLKKVLNELDTLQSSLFTPRAKKASINGGIARITALRKQQREASASHLQWKKIKRKLDDYRQREEQGEQQLKEISTTINLLSRHRDGLKHVAHWQQLQADLKELRSVPELPQEFAQIRVQTQTTLQQSRTIRENLQSELASLTTQRQEVTFDAKILAHGNIIESFARDASIHAKAQADGKSLRATLYRVNESVEESLTLLRPGLTLEKFTTFKLSEPEKSRIKRLISEADRLQQAQQAAEKEITELNSKLATHKARLDTLRQPKDTAELSALLSRASAYGRLEDQLDDLHQAISIDEEEARTRIGALGLWQGSLDALMELPLPNSETLRLYESRLTQLDQQRKSATLQRDVLTTRRQEKHQSLQNMSQQQQLPAQEDLLQQRRLRDSGWASVQAVWLEGAAVDQNFMAHYPDCSALAEAYDKSVQQADAIADVLQKDADTVAKIAALREDLHELETEIEESNSALASHNEQRDLLLAQWDALWQGLHITPLSPREMIVWTGALLEIRGLGGTIKKNQGQAAGLQKKIAQLTGEIITAHTSCGFQAPAEMGYSQLLELTKQSLQTNDALRIDQQNIVTTIATQEEHLARYQKQKEALRHKQAAWEHDWQEAIGKLDFTSRPRPDDVQEFIRACDTIFQQLRDAKTTRDREAAIQHDFRAYHDKLSALISSLAPDLTTLPPEQQPLRLQTLLRHNEEQKKTLQQLEAAIQKKTDTLAQETEKLAALEEKMRLLCAEAHVDSPEMLPDIELQSAEKVALTTRLTHMEERLLELAAGQDLQTFIHEVTAHNPDELLATISEAQDRKQQLEASQKQLVADLALTRQELEGIGGESRALDLAEEAEGVIAATQSDVDRYVTLRLSAALLLKAIERYRQANQSPVLTAASDFFCQITHGSFDGLRADYDSQGDPVIKAVRPDKRLLSVQELSDGSRDQLFLALRLGGLAHHCRHSSPIPFIVDDILVHFDDTRAMASLEAMAALARHTQIIFFTHHKHLLELLEHSSLTENVHLHSL